MIFLSPEYLKLPRELTAMVGCTPCWIVSGTRKYDAPQIDVAATFRLYHLTLQRERERVLPIDERVPSYASPSKVQESTSELMWIVLSISSPTQFLGEASQSGSTDGAIKRRNSSMFLEDSHERGTLMGSSYGEYRDRDRYSMM